MGTILYPPTLDWSYMTQRPQQLMRQFARDGHSVLFYNKQAQDGQVIEYPEPGIAVIRHAQAFEDELIAHLPRESRLFWTSWSRRLPQARRVHADYTVYDCVDDFPDWDEEERQYAANADLIVCTAAHLETKMRHLLPKHPLCLVPNGCDHEHFAAVLTGTHRRAEEAACEEVWQRVANHPGPVIGYIGAWAPWVNEEWIRSAAAIMPEALFYIAGPSLREETGPLGPNVVMLGYRSYDELPALLAMTQVCIIPFHLNRITQSTNPVKVYEYLAAGKPVVSSALPEVLPLQPYVATAASEEDFVRLLKKACVGKPTQSQERAERSAYAKAFSWQERYRTAAEALDRHCAGWRQSSRLPVEEWAAYFTKQVPLRFRTVNSYYADVCLVQDPPYIGHPPGGEYSTFLLVDSRFFQGNGALRRAYLEFEAAVPAGGAPESLPTVKLAWADASVPLERLTDRSKPESRSLGTLPLKRSADDSLVLDITSLLDALPKQGRYLLQLSADISYPFRMDHPQFTLLRQWKTKEERA
ncbi:glycosyltransferase [Gorillibacterium sp. CAU 1737]|uniref:glycosyltransferase n=1 Tax=Gorillibacterium sp. CAU 1737 TaxID=3140362 RepID=UPI00326182FC